MIAILHVFACGLEKHRVKQHGFYTQILGAEIEPERFPESKTLGQTAVLMFITMFDERFNFDDLAGLTRKKNR